MRTIVFLTVLFMLSALQSAANSKLSLPARQLADISIGRDVAGRGAESIGILFTITPGHSAEELDIESLTVTGSVGNIFIGSINPTHLLRLADHPAVSAVELSRESHSDMVQVRQHAETGISYIHTNPVGELNRSYRGKGVICALYDSGLDPNHVNFSVAGEPGKSRVKQVHVYTGYNGHPSTSLTTEQEIREFTTENSKANHGTHVLGIMAGAFSGNGYYSERVFNPATDSLQLNPSAGTNTMVDKTFSDSPLPYYGVAPESDIIIGCGTLYSANMLDLAMKVRDYSRAEGRPAVVNYSLGSNIGSRDGSSLFDQAMAEVGKDVIICFAAGNYANSNLSIVKSCNDDSNGFKTFIQPSSRYILDGSILDLWASDSRPFSLTLFLSNGAGENRVNLMTVDAAITDTRCIESTDCQSGIKNAVVNEDLDKYFTGYVTFNSGVDRFNNRYELYLQFSKQFKLRDSSTDIVLGIEVVGNDGQRVDASASNFTFVSNSVAGYTVGTPDLSISDHACGHNRFAIGNYVGRNVYFLLGEQKNYLTSGHGVAGTISPTSSYGTLADGRRLPHFSAPGSNIISSNNRYFMADESNSSTRESQHRYNSAYADVDGERYHWCAMSGTSMSSPVFAGICALWLEADPTLTWNDINDIATATCRSDRFTESQPDRFGAGKVDAYNGLKEVMKRASVVPVTAIDDSRIVVNMTGDILEVSVPDTDDFTVNVYSLSGTKLLSTNGIGTVSVDLSTVPSGICFAEIAGRKFRVTKKLSVKTGF